MADQNVMVGYLFGPTVTSEFHICMMQMEMYDGCTNRRIRRYAPTYSNVNICKHRNQLVHDFLDDTRCDWLWMLDQDATFPPNMLDALLADAEGANLPIVGALAHQYRGKTDENFEPVIGANGMQVRELMPTMYRTEWDADGKWLGYREIVKYELGLQPVDATGCHCLLVHRSVFEKIESDHPYRWFREDEIEPGTIAGEDIWFCIEATKAGFPIYVDTRLESGHVKPVVLTSEMCSVERIA